MLVKYISEQLFLILNWVFNYQFQNYFFDELQRPWNEKFEEKSKRQLLEDLHNII